MNDPVLEKARLWADTPMFDDEFRDEIMRLLSEENEAEIIDRFYKDLEFGTGGLRGIMGAGSNRMNIYTVRKATQGLADYINEIRINDSRKASVVIAYDCRNLSLVFSRETASVLAANGFRVFLFSRLTPTPMLSFAVRELGATAGIVITASHNPAEYNGYKVAWSDGCQVIEPHDRGIIKKVNSITDFSLIKWMDFQKGLQNKQIRYVKEEVEAKYFALVKGLSFGTPEVNEKLGVVFTPLHGAGNHPVRKVLKDRGFKKLTIVKEQEQPDGDFPTVSYPNPEEESALALAIQTAGVDDQLILATDPDADRLGVMIKHKKTWQKINGNQIGQLMLDYYLNNLKKKGTLPQDAVYITTIVTSALGRKIATKHGVTTYEVLTGFKYIGSIIRELEENKKGTFIFGTEESHGYLFGDFVRDKDGVSAAMIFAELCADLYQQGITPLDRLEQLHLEFGYHRDSLINKVYKGQDGADKIKQIMSFLRSTAPKELAGKQIILRKDYQSGDVIDCVTGKIKQKTGLPGSNVLSFYMQDGSRITARPSGTEPKIKFYFNLCGTDKAKLQTMKNSYEKAFIQIINSV